MKVIIKTSIGEFVYIKDFGQTMPYNDKFLNACGLENLKNEFIRGRVPKIGSTFIVLGRQYLQNLDRVIGCVIRDIYTGEVYVIKEEGLTFYIEKEDSLPRKNLENLKQILYKWAIFVDLYKIRSGFNPLLTDNMEKELEKIYEVEFVTEIRDFMEGLR